MPNSQQDGRRVTRIDALLALYYLGTIGTGLVGAWRPSITILNEIGRGGATIYLVGMVLMGAAGVFAVFSRSRRTERTAMRVIAALTVLHAAFLMLAEGGGGLQTGARLLTGAIGLLALAELRGSVYLSSAVKRHLSSAVEREEGTA